MGDLQACQPPVNALHLLPPLLGCSSEPGHSPLQLLHGTVQLGRDLLELAQQRLGQVSGLRQLLHGLIDLVCGLRLSLHALLCCFKFSYKYTCR